jgi:putative salt-induced outer membrane protein YdiY
MSAPSTKSLAAVLVLLSCVLAARGATWTLANGDRLTGELLREDAMVIEIQHAQLGRITVPRGALEVAPKPAGPRTTQADVRGGTATSTAVKPKVPKWKRQIDVGYSQQSGAREKQDLSVRVQVDGKEGANTFRATARLLQSEADTRTVTDRREADFRWRRDINKRLFTQALTTYGEDGVRKIDLNLEQQVGGGYRIVDGERHKVNVGIGAVVQYLDRENVEDETALLGALFQDYAYEMNSRLKVVQDSSVMYSESGALASRSSVSATAPAGGSYRLKFNTGLQSKVTDHMSLNVRFEFDYDRSIIDRDLRADQRLTTSLGYIW